MDQSLAGLAAMLAGSGTIVGSVFLRLTLVFFSMVAFKKQVKNLLWSENDE
jgi:hypothetical protein